MRAHVCAILLFASTLVGCGSGSHTTTTLKSQIANNTSAAGTFAGQSNGNLGANNVSKVNIHSLLYSGTNTKVLAHLMLWFGQSNHMDVGYSSTDPAQVTRQITDMISRGIDGVIVDWYGPNNSIDQAAKLVMKEAEKHPGFSFGIMVDQGAIQSVSCSGCTPQGKLSQVLKYVEDNYFVSSSYLKIEGQPMVTNFDVDRSYSIDWDAVNATLATPLRFVFQGNEGFAHTLSDGSYSWVMPWAADYGLGYLSSFYDTGLSFVGKETVGAAYKGFDDRLAAWGSGRHMDQQCGQTWLGTFSQVNQLHNSGRQLPYMQLVTWNDYEEGTEIESGIDSCFSLNASLSGSILQWDISGDENTVDHYSVYTSIDGQNLKELTKTQPGVHSMDLCQLPMAAGSQSVYVQAVGKPSLANRMTAPVSYAPACRDSN